VKKILVQFVVVIIAITMADAARLGSEDPTVEVLHAKDQALLDAIAPGNRKVWDEVLAPEAVYVDENGVTMNRAEYLKQLDPLPAGASGTLRIASYSAHVTGDLACVIHTDDEEENYHGQILHAQYLMTEAWRRDAGAWKLYIVHAYAVLKDPPAVDLPVAALAEYAGRYSGGDDLAYVVQWDGKQLTGGRVGRPLSPLRTEVRDVLFVPGQPRVRKIFQRDKEGRITGFVDRREGEDLVWHRETKTGS
jgi:ketosteroid isomerase-like protein